jgi:hypothetical protein
VTPWAPALARGLVPFAFGRSTNLDALDLTPLGVPLRPIAAERPASHRFHTLLHRMNAHAFGGMGMPMWVQLDCAALPSAFIGFAAAASQLPDALARALDAHGDELVPVAEALCVPSATPATWVSVSLAAVLPGLGLGLASKLLGLTACRVERALGVTQYDNIALRTHTRLGPLVIVEPQAPFHTRAESTFLYELQRPAAGWHVDPPDGGAPSDISFDPDAPRAAAVIAGLHRRAQAAHSSLLILPPGLMTNDGSRRIPLAIRG